YVAPAARSAPPLASVPRSAPRKAPRPPRFSLPHTASFKGNRFASPATTTFRPHRLADRQYRSPGHPRDHIGRRRVEGDARRQDADQAANQHQTLAGLAAVEVADEEQDLGDLKRQEDAEHGGM